MKTRAQELGEAIEKDRAKTGASQEDVAKEVGVTQQAFSGWEAGQSMPRTTRLQKLREFFGPQSETAMVVDHYLPQRMLDGTARVRDVYDADFKEQTNSEHFVRRRPNIRQVREALHVMGNQTGSNEKEPPRKESTDGDIFHEPETKWNIKSFESHNAAPLALAQAEDIVEALNRAQNGVQLARQVLDDASNQITRALSQLSK